MKTINIKLELPTSEEQDLNISIVVRKGGEVEFNTLPSSPKPIQEELLPIENTSINNIDDNIVDKKSSTKKRKTSSGKKTDPVTSTTDQKKVSGNYMDMEF